LPREGFCPGRRTPKLEKKLSIMKMLIINAEHSYGLIPALSLELLFRLAGMHVFLILDFQDQ
jgi:hypothetical protein